MENLRLTEFSPGAGCGCKISPKDLEAILSTQTTRALDPRLLVGNQSRDDAAVVDLGNGSALVSTTDFFTPIVDDAFDFGRIAGVNAISDIYAMGGRPLVAIAVLGWPLAKLPAELAARVVEGGREACALAGISLAGGHSIDVADPIFGLAVTGIVPIPNIRRNDTATHGCELFLTKPLGVGIVTTAEKRKLVKKEHLKEAVELMSTLNDIGIPLAGVRAVRAMTDVTGFGLLGHLLEMCNGSALTAEIRMRDVPVLAGVLDYVLRGCVPGGTTRNWASYGRGVEFVGSTTAADHARPILCDPQTSGGLLIAVESSGVGEVCALAGSRGLALQSFGQLTQPEAGSAVRVRVHL